MIIIFYYIKIDNSLFTYLRFVFAILLWSELNNIQARIFYKWFLYKPNWYISNLLKTHLKTKAGVMCKILSTTWQIVTRPTRNCFLFVKGFRQEPHDEGSIPESSIVRRGHVDPRFHFLVLHNGEEREGRPISYRARSGVS